MGQQDKKDVFERMELKPAKHSKSAMKEHEKKEGKAELKKTAAYSKYKGMKK